MISKAAEFFISRCFKDGKVMAIQPNFNEKYSDGNKEHKFTEAVLEEMLSIGKIKITYQHSKYVNLMGVNTYED